MPELPEVEIVRRNLTRWTVGARIVGVTAPDRGRIEGDLERLVGAQVVGWRRRGKLLIGSLSGEVAVLSHLGMTGKWVKAPGERRFQRIVLAIEGGPVDVVALVDARRLGRTWIVDAGEVDVHPRVAKLGREPLDPALDAAAFAATVGASTRPLKTALLDQSRVAGLGNICVIEGCSRARLHPHSPSRDVAPRQWAALLEGLRAHIAATLAAEDGDEVAYINEGGPNPFIVYGRAGEPCGACGTAIVRTTLAKRPTFTCPSCQPGPSRVTEEAAA